MAETLHVRGIDVHIHHDAAACACHGKVMIGNDAPRHAWHKQFCATLSDHDRLAALHLTAFGEEAAEEAAAAYDVDVEKQAQQLGLPGW